MEHLSVPDFLLQAFVIVMSLWAVWAKLISPRLPRFSFPAKLLTNESHDVMATATPNPVPVRAEVEVPVPKVNPRDFGLTEDGDDPPEGEEEEEEEDDDDEDGGEGQFDFYDNVGTGDDDGEEEDNEDEGMATHEQSDLTATIAKKPSVTGFKPFLPNRTQNDPFYKFRVEVSKILGQSNHIIVIGASGGGKTVTMHQMAQLLFDDGIQVVVGDPDAAPGDWPGDDVFGGGDDFESINSVLAGLGVLMKERRVERTQGIRTFAPIWFFLDEYGETARECPLASTVVENALRRARKLNIHLCIGVQDTQVKTMGFERKSSLLEHARIIKLALRANGSRYLYQDDEPPMKVPDLRLTPAVVGETLEETAPQTVFRQYVPDSLDLNDDEGDEGDGEEGEEPEGDGKEQVIRQLLLAKPPWSYQRIVLHMSTSSARVSRIKHKLQNEGLL